MLMKMDYRTTLDIDTNDKEFIGRVVEKIIRCRNLKDFYIEPSKFKGFHIILFCNKKCDICRMCYDDSRRFAYDQNRPEYATNILFDEKEIINNES